MLVDILTTYVEMNSLNDLRPGQQPPTPVEMKLVSQAARPDFLRDIYLRIATPHSWRPTQWSEQEWQEWLAKPLQHWVAEVDSEPAGLISLDVQDDHVVEIFVFGLVPEFVGKGFGGHILSRGVELAWNVQHQDGEPTRRVWLHTSSADHRNALSNYLSRGFRVFKAEHEVKDRDEPAADRYEERARHILSSVPYVAIATASASEGAWNTPVFGAFDAAGNLYWTSSPSSRHSQNIAADPRVCVVVFDSKAPAGEGVGVFFSAAASELTADEDVSLARRLLNDRAGAGALESDAYYRAVPQRAWMNDIEIENGEYVRDIRVELPLSVLRT